MEKKLHERLRKIGVKLREEYHAKSVLLYGSYAKGTQTKESDVDVLVIAPTKEKFFERMSSVRRIIRVLRDGLPVAPVVLTPEEIEKRKKIGDPFIVDILQNGVSL